MSDTVESLPAEYRTPSLESLPKELQVLAVKNIRKKFGLGKAPETEIEAKLKDQVRALTEELVNNTASMPDLTRLFIPFGEQPKQRFRFQVGDLVKAVREQGYADHKGAVAYGWRGEIEDVYDSGKIRVRWNSGDTSVYFPDQQPYPENCLRKM